LHKQKKGRGLIDLH